MESGLKLGRLWGIPIRLHLSWFLIFALVTWSLAVGYFPAEYPTLSPLLYWVLGAVTSLLFFVSVLAHELGHAVVARRNDVPVRGITLFIFGGVAQIGREPPTAGAEFRIAIAGPLVSLALAALFQVAWWFDREISFLAAPSAWLARINLILAVFNLLPGFPLDGGRILRAVIWQVTGNARRATQAATLLGQVVAFGLMGWGVFLILSGAFFNGLWLIFIGWFLQNAAASSYAQANVQEALRGMAVGEVMTRDCPLVSGGLSLQQLVDDHILTGQQRCFFIADHGLPRGLLSLTDVARVPRAQWSRVTAEQVMKPWADVVHVAPETDLLAALLRMDDARVAQVPVVKNGELVGLLSREHVLHYIRLRSELGL